MAMINATELRPGMLIEHEGKLCSVLKVEHRTPGNKRGFVQGRLRDVNTGAGFEHRFRSIDTIEQVVLDHKQVEFLYEDAGTYHFMDTATYEQFALQADVLGDAPSYVLPNTNLQISFHEGRPVAVELPLTVELKVTDTEPGIKGATVTASKKPATVETGLVVQVPQFVEKGTVIKVDTRDGSYIDRVG